MCRGELCFLVLVIVGTASVSVHGVPLHENFGGTSPDLLALIMALSDVTVLCDDSLQWSFDAQGTLTFAKPMVLVFSNESLSHSLRSSEALQENLSGFSGYLAMLENHAESYWYLRELLLPLQGLGVNVTFFVEGHRDLLENLTTSVTYINRGGNATEAVDALGNIRSLVTQGRVSLQNIEWYAEVIRSNFSVDALERLAVSLSEVLETYDAYASSLLELYTGVHPHLMLYANDTVVSLGETVSVYGYFIAQQSFVSDQMIRIQMGNQTLDSIGTDEGGGFTMALPIGLDHPLGPFPVNASTVYHHTMYHSEKVFVTVQMIPTTLTFFCNATHVYVNESFRVSGRLSDDHTRGVHATVTVHLAGGSTAVDTNETGNYTFVFDETLPFGMYSMVVSFASDQIYASCESRNLTIAVDTPTGLTLALSATRVSVGDSVLCTGQLTSLIDGSPVPQKPIEIMGDNKHVASGATNTTGWYTVVVPTQALPAGVSLLSAVFTADEPRWRNATSTAVELTLVMMFPYWDALLVIGAIVALVPVFLFFRRRIITLGKKKPLRMPTVTPTAIVSPSSSESPRVNTGSLLDDISSTTEEEIREAIILRYHQLIHLLSSTGVRFSPDSTHRDIKTMLIQQGLSKDATEVITDLFELAQYSPYPLGAKEAVMFNANLRALMETVGGYLWIQR